MVNWKIEKLNNKHFSSLVECVQKTFPANSGEVMANSLGITPEEYLPFTDVACLKAIKDEVSYVATDNATGSVIGYCISEDFMSARKYSEFKFSPKFAPLFSLLEELDESYLLKKNITNGEVFHLYMLGVLPEYSSFGLGKELILNSLNLAKQLGFKKVVAEATGLASQRICEKLGFETLAKRSYDNYLFKNERVFAGIKGPLECHLVENKI